jgi:hypothetical protein
MGRIIYKAVMYIMVGGFLFILSLLLSSIFFLIFHPRLCFIAARRLRTCIPNHISPMYKCWAIGRFVLLLLSSIRRAVQYSVHLFLSSPTILFRFGFLMSLTSNGPFLLFFCWERMTFKGPAVLSSEERQIK